MFTIDEWMRSRNCSRAEAERIQNYQQLWLALSEGREIAVPEAKDIAERYQATLAAAFPSLTACERHRMALYVAFDENERGRVRFDPVKPVVFMRPNVFAPDFEWTKSRASVIRTLLDTGAAPEFILYAARTRDDAGWFSLDHSKAVSEGWPVPKLSQRDRGMLR